MSESLTSSPPSLLRQMTGLSLPVNQGQYLRVGAALMALKYAVDAGVVYAFTGQWATPLLYLLPIATLREELLAGVPETVLAAMVVWTLPFAWIGVSMSVRRARDAGLHPATGLIFLMPIVNYLLIVALAALPSRAAPPTPGPLQGPHRGVAAALVGVFGGAGVAVTMTLLSVSVLGSYGATLFLGTPFLMGAVSGILYNLRAQQSAGSTAMVGLATVGAAGGLMLLFAMEGLVCLTMASPLIVPLGMLGALFGRSLAQAEARRALIGPVALLPLLTAVEPSSAALVHEVSTVVEVNAPPEKVWTSVVEFSDIPSEDLAWYFRLGLAWPQRARIEGEGVGAIRHCEFSTGAFVEPITAWEPPRRLAFSVISNPPTMQELSPWSHVYAPHLDGTLQSRRGEFLLEPLPGGRTRLTGTTWYTFDMAPVAYWSAWSNWVIHSIHRRVLGHVASLAEGS